MHATLSHSAELVFGDKQWSDHYNRPSVEIDLAWKDVQFDEKIKRDWNAKQAGLRGQTNLTGWGISPPNTKNTGKLCITCGVEAVKARERCRICYGIYYRANLAHLKRDRKER